MRSMLARLLGVILIAMPSAVWGVTRTWNVGSGNWNTAANWSPSGVPAANDDVTTSSISSGHITVSYDYTGSAITLNSLDLRAFTATGGQVTLSIAANSLTVNNETLGGLAGWAGTITQSGGSNVINTGDLVLGNASNSQGTYNLSGTGVLTALSNSVSDDEIIGNSGTGTFHQTGGTNSLNVIELGANTNSNGTYNLDLGNLDAYNEYVSFGSGSTGTFTQTGGLNSVGNAIEIGSPSNSSASGSYQLSSNGHLAVTKFEQIGGDGQGTFTQNDTSLNTSPYVGLSNGTYNLNGGTLTITPSNGALGLQIGIDQSGTFNQAGGVVTVSNSSATGNVTVDAAGVYNLQAGSITADNETIGSAGSGTFTQTGGTNIINTKGNLMLGSSAGSAGAYNLNGGTLYVTSGTANVTEIIGSSGTGNFTQSAGENDADTIGVGTASGGSGNYTMTGGTIQGDEVVINIGYSGSSGTFNQSGGQVTTAQVNLATYGGAAIYNLSGTAQLFSNYVIDVGQGLGGTSTFNQTGGFCEVNALTIRSTQTVSSYNLSGSGILSAISEIVGSFGDSTIAVFNQTGGNNSVSGELDLGEGTEANGVYNLSRGSLTVAGATYVSGSTGFPASGTGGTFNQSGGDSQFQGNLIIAGKGAFNLSGSGFVAVFGQEIVGDAAGTATFMQTGGTQVVGQLIINGTSGSNGIFTISGGSTSAGAVQLGAGAPGQLTLTGSGTMIASSIQIDSGTFTQSGGMINTGLVENNDIFSQTAGVASLGSVIGTGSMTIAGSASASSVIQNSLTVTGALSLTPGGGSSSVNTLSIGPSGKLDLANNSLTINSTGPTLDSTIRGYLLDGYNAGQWNGVGIDSVTAAENSNHSTALGYLDTGAQVQIKYTWLGDTNLDGVVNSSDLSAMSISGTTWGSGDFNYDGVVNADDYSLLMLGISESGGVNISAMLPEPALAVTLGGLLFLSRRRCK